MALTAVQIAQNREEFLNLLSKVNRPGINSLIDWLSDSNKCDFFIAPSSCVYHSAFDGGLCFHTLNVYKALKSLVMHTHDIALPEKQVADISEETLIIVALLHDLCKVNFYQKEVRSFKDTKTGQWKRYYAYTINDTYPLGHSEKSVIMAQNFIQLTPTEILAIRWHMGNAADPGALLSPYEKPALNKAENECPLVVLMQQADYFASYMMEPMGNPQVDNLIDL